MDRIAYELHNQTKEHMNRERAMRTTMSAIWVFLEGRWTFDDDDDNNNPKNNNFLGQTDEKATEPAPADIIQQAFKIINKRQDLWGDGGWPSDVEVEFYLSNNRSKKKRVDYDEECRRFESMCRDHAAQRRLKGFRKAYV